MDKKIYISIFVISLLNLLFGKIYFFLGLIFLTIIFFPILTLSNKSSMLSLKVFNWTVSSCMFFGFYFFYLYFNTYNQFIYFSFEDLDYLEVFVKVGLFSLFVVIFVRLYEKVLGRSKFKYFKDTNKVNNKNVTDNFLNKNSKIYIFLIIFIVAISIPLMNMMIELGIGVTGTRPTRLPFKLTGILVHFFKTFLPLLLVVLYLTTKRNSIFIILSLSVFAIYGGIILSSKTIIISILIIPLFFAIFDRRWFLAFLIILISSFGLEMIALTREYLYLTIDNIVYVNKEFNFTEIFLTQIKTINLIESLRNILLIFDRIISFKGLYVASKIPASEIMSGFNVWLHTIDWGLFLLPVDELHYMSLGYNVNLGLYNLTSDILTKFFWSIDNNFAYLILMTFTVSVLLIIAENTINKIKVKYNVKNRFVNLSIVFFTISIITNTGYPVLKYLYLIIFFISFFPKIKQIEKILLFLKINKKSNT